MPSDAFRCLPILSARSEEPVTCSVRTSGGDSALEPAALQAAWMGVPVAMAFNCEGVTITGIELEVSVSAC